MATWNNSRLFNKLFNKPARSSKPAHLSAGEQAERLAETYLKRQGMRLLERNYRCPLGEIDLIMQQGEQLVFVEVRYRKQTRYGSPTETITPSKQAKLHCTAQHYLQNQGLLDTMACRFDVISVLPTHSAQSHQPLEWIENAF